jgi:hypothetical protein
MRPSSIGLVGSFAFPRAWGLSSGGRSRGSESSRTETTIGLSSSATIIPRSSRHIRCWTPPRRASRPSFRLAYIRAPIAQQHPGRWPSSTPRLTTYWSTNRRLREPGDEHAYKRHTKGRLYVEEYSPTSVLEKGNAGFLRSSAPMSRVITG